MKNGSIKLIFQEQKNMIESISNIANHYKNTGKLYNMHKEENGLFVHQNIPINYIENHYSLLLNFEPGSGKTRIPIMVAKKLFDFAVLVLAPAALLENFKKEIDTVNKNLDEKIDTSRFTYLSTNSSVFHIKYPEIIMDYKKQGIKKVMLVIDESHILTCGFSSRFF